MEPKLSNYGQLRTATLAVKVPSVRGILGRGRQCAQTRRRRRLGVPGNALMRPMKKAVQNRVRFAPAKDAWQAHHVVVGASTRICLKVRVIVDDSSGMMLKRGVP